MFLQSKRFLSLSAEAVEVVEKLGSQIVKEAHMEAEVVERWVTRYLQRYCVQPVVSAPVCWDFENIWT